MRRYASQRPDRRSTRSNKRCPAPPAARIALDDVARIQSTNVICTHARRKPVVSATVVVTPAVVAVTPAVISSGDRCGSCQEAQRCKSDKICLHDGSPLLLRIKHISTYLLVWSSQALPAPPELPFRVPGLRPGVWYDDKHTYIPSWFDAVTPQQRLRYVPELHGRSKE
jgi:hypothetical protein